MGVEPVNQIKQGRTAVTAAGTPQRLSTVEILVDSVELHARKNVTTANTGAVYVGVSKNAGENYRVLLAGETFTMTANPGRKLNLQNIFIDAATTADAVTWTSLS